VCNAQLSLTGLQGGHSGLQIDQGLGNAVQQVGMTLMRLLSPPSGAAGGVALVEVAGGDKRNAIAREAGALLLVSGWAGHVAGLQQAGPGVGVAISKLRSARVPFASHTILWGPSHKLIKPSTKDLSYLILKVTFQGLSRGLSCACWVP
jgi:hypothetical protein